MEIISKRHQELATSLQQQLQALAETEFGGFDIVRETAWAIPDWCFLGMLDGELACCYSLVLRQARFDGQPVLIAGLNNLITVPAFRGRGLASQLLVKTEQDWFGRLAGQCALLLCADGLLSYYSSLGWQQVESELWFDQPDGKRLWQANCMLLTADRTVLTPAKIDLCGFPW